jgi:hypothetical protein
LSWLLQGAQALKEHPKLRRAVADTILTNEYIVVLQSSRNNLRTSTVEKQPWFLAELTEEELVDLLDDDAVAFIEQVRPWQMLGVSNFSSFLLLH